MNYGLRVFLKALTTASIETASINRGIVLKMNSNSRLENRKYSAEYCLIWRKLVKDRFMIYSKLEVSY